MSFRRVLLIVGVLGLMALVGTVFIPVHARSALADDTDKATRSEESAKKEDPKLKPSKDRCTHDRLSDETRLAKKDAKEDAKARCTEAQGSDESALQQRGGRSGSAEAAPTGVTSGTLELAGTGSEVTAGSGGADPPVAVVDNAFEPATITISVGDTITWTNEGDKPHTVTADDGSFDSGQMNSGQTFSYTFTAAGEYGYQCLYHGGMVGVVRVQAAAAAGAGAAEEEATGGEEAGAAVEAAGEAVQVGAGLASTGIDVLQTMFMALGMFLVGAVMVAIGRKRGVQDP